MSKHLLLSALVVLAACADTDDPGYYSAYPPSDPNDVITTNILTVSNATDDDIAVLYLRNYADSSFQSLNSANDPIESGDLFQYAGYGPGTWAVDAVDFSGNCAETDPMQVEVDEGQILTVTFSVLPGSWSSSGCE